MAVKSKVKTKFVEKTHGKVWNVSDHPETDTPATPLVIGGQVVMPGSAAKIPLDVLENPTKLKAAAAAGFVHIGDQPPSDYLKAKHPPRVTLPANVKRAHGPSGAPAAEKPAQAAPAVAPRPAAPA